jgi:hypothetical protein
MAVKRIPAHGHHDREEWPKLRERIEALDLDPADLLNER